MSVCVAAPAPNASAAPTAFHPSFSIGELSRGGAQLLGLAADLCRIHACAYCMLRYANVKQEQAYMQSKEWLQSYTSIKLGWPHVWATDSCSLCLGILPNAHSYYTQHVESSLVDSTTGERRWEVDRFTLNISEPVLTKIRNYATVHVLKPRYSRLQFGLIDLKDAHKWQMSGWVSACLGSSAKYQASGSADFSLLLTYTTDIPHEEYDLIVRTLPPREQHQWRRRPGDFALPMSNNPSLKDPKVQEARAKYNGKGKKNPRQDAMGQRTVLEALPKIKSEQWNAMDIFRPLNAASSAASDAASAAASTQPSSSSDAIAKPAALPSSASSPDTSSSSAMDTSDSLSSAAGIVVPASYPLPLRTLVPSPILSLVVRREPVLLCGHYRKYYRLLSQSPWSLASTVESKKRKVTQSSIDGAAANATNTATTPTPTPSPDDGEEEFEEEEKIDGDDEDGDDDDDVPGMRRMTDTSVEEEIVRCILPHFQPREYKFHSSGREDMDVRMLGNGRMFFIEIADAKKVPKSAGFCAQLQSEINSSTDYIEVLQLHYSNKKEFNTMKQSITTKRKAYRCVVWIKEKLSGADDERLKKLSAINDLVLQQKTPIRVLHRRSLLTRPKHIYSARTEYVNPHFFYLDVVTSSGTYVKEFVHGDRGRTHPSVRTIVGCQTEILQLDVIGFDSPNSHRA